MISIFACCHNVNLCDMPLGLSDRSSTKQGCGAGGAVRKSRGGLRGIGVVFLKILGAGVRIFDRHGLRILIWIIFYITLLNWEFR